MTPTPMGVDAVIFDLDDTLILEYDFVLSGYAAVAQRVAPLLGFPEDGLLRRLTQIYETPDRARAFDTLLTPFGRGDLISTCIDTYRGHTPQIQLTPEAEAVLTHFLQCVPVGVVTDGPLVMQEAKVAALGLRNRGVEVVCTDALGGKDAWKPSPVGLLEVLSRIGVEPARSVYIADNPHKDFIATARAGVLSIRLRHVGQLHYNCEPRYANEPMYEVADLRDVLALINCPQSCC